MSTAVVILSKIQKMWGWCKCINTRYSTVSDEGGEIRSLKFTNMDSKRLVLYFIGFAPLTYYHLMIKV